MADVKFSDLTAASVVNPTDLICISQSGVSKKATANLLVGGSTTQLQYNNAGAFGGVPTLTYDGTDTVLDLSASVATRIKIKGYSGAEGTLQCFNFTVPVVCLTNNVYLDGTNWRYIATGGASILYMLQGQINMYYMASGTAGAIATPILGFRLDVAGVITADGGTTTQWNAAYAQTRQWDGGATGLVAATGRTSLGATTIGNSFFTASTGGVASYARITAGGGLIQDSYATVLTNIGATDASVVPNTAPTAGKLLVGQAGFYQPISITGSGATFSMSAAGILTIDNIANASITNSAITIGNSALPTPLGSTANVDGILGISGSTAGLVKKTAAQTYALAVAGTDYPAAANFVRTFTTGTAATYTPAAAIRALYVELIGGGGGGGGAKSSASNCAPAGGGGGGGYSALMIASPAASYTYTVGQGGAGGGTGGGDGVDGTNTTFTGVTAGGGGVGGTGLATGAATPGWPANGVTGGTGSYGGGGDGNQGYRVSGTVGRSGDGGSSHFAGATIGRTTGPGEGVGTAGTLYGGGGAGALSTSATGFAGGAGADGIIRIWEFY